MIVPLLLFLFFLFSGTSVVGPVRNGRVQDKVPVPNPHLATPTLRVVPLSGSLKITVLSVPVYGDL